jgi:RimJ/RimL family protein N-acetyltransferase
LVSLIHPENHASIRVAQKIGAIFEEEYDLNGTPHVIYGQDAPWHASPRTP